MLDQGSQIADDCIREYQQLAGSRGTLEAHWQEIAQRVLPMDSYLFTQGQNNSTKGDKRNLEVYDSTAVIALGRFAAIMDSLLTPRNQTWHRVLPSDPHLMKDRETRLWFEEANRMLFKYRYAPKANFASQNQQVFHSLGGYGTGSMFTDKLSGEPGFRYKNIHLSQVYFRENHQGLIDSAYRCFPLTARQALQKFGDKTPARIRELVKVSPDREFLFLHCVKPRLDRDPERVDFKGMAFASYYISMEGKAQISEEGYNTFPYATSRYFQATGEIYGRSPAMDALPAIKTLNEQKKTVLKQGHRIVDPILLFADDGIMDTASLRPGTGVAGGVNEDGRPLVHTLPTGNLAVSKDLMNDERQLINDAFLVNLFQILVDSPAMSATEVMERSREKGILIAPTVGRQQSEYLGPQLEREFDLLAQQRLLGPMPPALQEAGGQYRIEYDSPLSRAQRAEEASGLMRTVEAALNVVNVTQDHTPLFHFNWDIIVPELAEINAVPARWMNDPKVVEQMKADKADQEQTQTAIQGAPAAAAMVKAAAVAQKKG